ncbi:hypothetical protein BSZ10_00735 [Staphylococcus aureus]|nr:hypothetical protein BSZ10_00735 [Staphylococcus aureus]
MLGHPILFCLSNFWVKFFLLVPPPQLALLVEFLGEILFAGAPDDKNALQSFIFQCLLRRAYINFSVNAYDTFISAL